MFPYRDENETLRAAVVTGVLIALNVLVWIMVQGAGSTMALARSVCNLGLTSRRDELPDWRWVGLRYGSRPAGRAFSNLDVPAWLLDASVGEYVVPVALWQQCRGFHGTAAFFDLLSALWVSGCHGTSVDESQLGDSNGWCLRSHQRGHGRLSGTLSEGPSLRAGIPWFLYDLGGSARLDDARLLVAHSVCEWVSGLRRRCRRCGLLGSCRRVCGRCGAGEAVRPFGLHRSAQSEPVAATQTHARLLTSVRSVHHRDGRS
jgi:hypothetical protein